MIYCSVVVFVKNWDILKKSYYSVKLKPRLVFKNMVLSWVSLPESKNIFKLEYSQIVKFYFC